MIPVPSGVRVWLAVGHTDMRRGLNSLAIQIQQGLGRDPHAGDLYVSKTLCTRRRYQPLSMHRLGNGIPHEPPILIRQLFNLRPRLPRLVDRVGGGRLNNASGSLRGSSTPSPPGPSLWRLHPAMTAALAGAR
jgi:hypothetical protein